MESVLKGCQEISSAVVGGHGEFQASLSVEPKHPAVNDYDKAQLLEDIWPTIQETSPTCPAHGRIMREFVAFMTPEKSLPRASEDSVQRQAALNMYVAELEALYERRHEGPPTSRSTNAAKSEANYASAMNGHAANGHTHPDQYNGIELGLSLAHDKVAPSQSTTNRTHHKNTEMTIVNADSIAITAKLKSIIETSLAHALTEQIATVLKQIARNIRSSGTVTPLTTNNPKSSRIPASARNDLRRLLGNILTNHACLASFADDSDLFDCWLDSSQVPVIVDEINRTVKNLGLKIELGTSRTIYGQRSVVKMVDALKTVEAL